MPRKADVAEFPSLLRLQECRLGTLVIEDSMRIVEADDLVVLDQVDAVRFQSFERFIDLLRSLLLGAAVDLGHQENSIPITFLEGLAHPDLTLTLVVVP